MSNIIDSIQLSGTVYTIQGSGGGSGNPTVEVTQAEYDALVSAGTVSANTYYIITDAYSPDISAITSSVTSASTDSEIPTAKAVWEAASGGGTTYTAGRGIDITNDTISLDMPLSAGSGNYSTMENAAFQSAGYASHAEGNYTYAFGNNSHAEGRQTQAIGSYSHAEGGFTNANNQSEHASGQYNVSNKANTTWGDSGNTLFSVGNGTADNERHNALEIRQNGDIYITLNGQDVKLQDNLGGGGGGKAVSGGTNISITTGETADTINCTLPYYKLGGTDNYSIYGITDQLFINKATYAYQSIFIGTTNEVKGDSASKSYSNNYVIGTNNIINGHITDYSKGYNVVIGDNNRLSGTNLSYSYVIGQSNSGYTSNTLLTGRYNQAYNYSESTFGKYNVSNTGSTDADKTLFSVGNGTSNSARHNAFEIRQNGDCYLNNGTSDVKLQDYLQIKVVKLTQSAYDALSPNYDSNTLYIIKD